jgi:hypothetical protein
MTTAWAIALRVVDLLVFESRAIIASVAAQLPPPSAIPVKISGKDSLFGSTEHAEINDSRRVDRLLGHAVARRITQVPT